MKPNRIDTIQTIQAGLPTVAAIAPMAGADAMSMDIMFGENRMVRSLGAVGFDPAMIQAYNERYHRIDPRIMLIQKFASHGVIFTEELRRPDGPEGRAEQIAGGNRQFRGVAKTQVSLGQGQLKVDAFGQEILDEEGLGAEGRGVEVGQHVDAPDTARGGGGDGKGEGVAACGIGCHGAGIFHAIGALQDRGQGQPFDG